MPTQKDKIIVDNMPIMGKMISFLPVSLPPKIYRAASLVPVVRTILNKFILSIIPVQITIPEGVIMLDQTDVAVSGSLALGVFENTEINLFRKYLKPNLVVVDIGANIGYYTIIAGKHIGPEGQVFAYEPEDRNYSLLKKNIEANGLANTIPIKIGLSKNHSICKLYLDENNKGRHSLAFKKNKEESTIETDTLDNSLKQHGSPKVDIIKMDIEGAEFLALDGMRETIKRSPYLIIFTEFYPKAIIALGGDPLTYLKKLIEFGFSISVIDEDSGQITPILNTEQFMQNFPGGESFKNIFAVKKR